LLEGKFNFYFYFIYYILCTITMLSFTGKKVLLNKGLTRGKLNLKAKTPTLCLNKRRFCTTAAASDSDTDALDILDQLVLPRKLFYMETKEFRSAVAPGADPSNFSQLVEKAKRWADPKNPLLPVDPHIPTSPMDVISKQLKPEESLESPEITLRNHPELLFVGSMERKPASEIIAQLSSSTNIPPGVIKKLLPNTTFAKLVTDSIQDTKVADAEPAEYLARLMGWKYSKLDQNGPLYQQMATLGFIPK